MTNTILFLASTPDGEAKLAIDKECRLIREKIQASSFPKDLELRSEWAVRPSDLLQYFNQYRPQVVHFSGHGSNSDELILQDNDDQPKPVSNSALRALFATMKDRIRLVVLNACYSQPQAEAITESIDCAVGMKTEINDQVAIIFSGAFYRALGFGRSVKEAFDQGCVELLLEGTPQHDVPKLHVRNGVDPNQVFLAGTSGNNPQPSPVPARPKRDLVYISYSHKDKQWFKRLRAILDTDPEIRDLIWDDTFIPPSKNFATEIDQHVARAKVMIMLASEPYFGPNSGAARCETGPGLQAHRNGEMDILWFPVGVHSFANSPVGHIMAATGAGAIPLELLSTEEQDDALRKVHQAVRVTLGLPKLVV